MVVAVFRLNQSSLMQFQGWAMKPSKLQALLTGVADDAANLSDKLAKLIAAAQTEQIGSEIAPATLAIEVFGSLGVEALQAEPASTNAGRISVVCAGIQHLRILNSAASSLAQLVPPKPAKRGANRKGLDLYVTTMARVWSELTGRKATAARLASKHRSENPDFVLFCNAVLREAGIAEAERSEIAHALKSAERASR